MNPNSKPFARTSRPVRRSRRTLAVAGIALLSLTAAACGDDDEDGASTTAPAASSSGNSAEASVVLRSPHS